MPPITTNEKKWNDMYQQLISYKDKHGNCLVSHMCGDNTTLASWVSLQRTNYKNNKLSNDRIQKLKSLGFVFEAHEMVWDDMYNRLVLYKERYGDCFVPKTYGEDKKLATWVKTQRFLYKNDKLSGGRIDKLQAIGFVFTVDEDIRSSIDDNKWDSMYNRLILYKENYGNCLVPALYSEDKKLGNWVQTQRFSYKNDKLSSGRIDKLKAIGFVCVDDETIRSSIDNNKWDGMYNRLVLYKEKYGDCLVPALYSEDKKLGNWVKTQRNSYKNNNLCQDRIDKLKAIGFVCVDDKKIYSSIHDIKWDGMYNRLKLYKEKYGDCLLPALYSEDKKLGNWVRAQRNSYKNNNLCQNRIDKLKSLGFVFSGKQGGSKLICKSNLEEQQNYINGTNTNTKNFKNIQPSATTTTKTDISQHNNNYFGDVDKDIAGAAITLTNSFNSDNNTSSSLSLTSSSLQHKQHEQQQEQSYIIDRAGNKIWVKSERV